MKLSRRNLLHCVGTAGAIGALGLTGKLARSQSAIRTGGTPRTLALIGDRYHNPDYIRVSLNRVFKELNLPIDYTANYYDLSASLLKPYQLFICFRDNMIWPGGYDGPNASSFYSERLENADDFPSQKFEAWITEEQGQAVKDFVAAGNGFYSMHNNAFVSRSSKIFLEVQGGFALGHPPLRPFKVKIVNRNHPITQGVEDFMVNDEQHYLVYDKDPKNVLLQPENIDGLVYKTASGDVAAGRPVEQKNLGTTTVSGWAHEYGKGRVAFTAMGHTIHAMWQQQYLKIQKNAVCWLLKQT